MNEIKFAQEGDNVEIYQPVTFIKPEMIHLKNFIIISEFSYINGGLGTYIGNHVHIATQSCISGGGYCFIEDFAGISAGVKLITGSARFNGEGLTSPTLPKKFQSVKRSYIVLKKHSVLATNVVVHPGVTIGEGTIVASGSVVTKDTEPWSIYMGIPAKKIRDRNPLQIKELEKLLYSEQNLISSDFSLLIEKVKNNDNETDS